MAKFKSSKERYNCSKTFIQEAVDQNLKLEKASELPESLNPREIGFTQRKLYKEMSLVQKIIQTKLKRSRQHLLGAFNSNP